MKRPSKYGSLRRGDIGPDGRIFFAYNRGRELWCSEERFKEKVEIVKQYEVRDKKRFDSKEHPPLWHYDLNTRLYYAGRVSAKERWVGYEEYIMIRNRRERMDKAYKLRCSKIQKAVYNIGDPHPDDPELFLAYYSCNKPYWKNRSDLEKYFTKRREIANRCLAKCRIRKEKILRKLNNKLKRGTVLNDKIFWEYTTYGKEVWLEKIEYDRRMHENREKSRRHRANKRAAGIKI